MFAGRLISLHLHFELRSPRNLNSGTRFKDTGDQQTLLNTHETIYRPMSARNIINVVITMQESLLKHVVTLLRSHLVFSFPRAAAQF
jgi:hypothetical protein